MEGNTYSDCGRIEENRVMIVSRMSNGVRADTVRSLILGPDKNRDLRGIPIRIGIKPLTYCICPHSGKGVVSTN
jgi:hypothetical protein